MMSTTTETTSRRSADPRVSVVIPALNEAANLPHVLSRVPSAVSEVILVDGGSMDGTIDVARRVMPEVKVVSQNRKGKGNALACGFAVATGDIIVMIDADGSTEPGEIPLFVEALVEGADFAKGTRYSGGGGSEDISRVRSLGNMSLNALVNALFGTRFTDLCYGYNAFWRDCLDILSLDVETPPSGDGSADRLWGDGFEIETLINIRFAAAGMRLREVPSYERRRIHGESNLHAVRDGIRIARTIATERRRLGRPQGKATVGALPRPSQRSSDEQDEYAGSDV